MIDILLIYPPIFFNKNGTSVVMDVSYPPLGILYLASSLEMAGFNVKVLDVGAQKLSLQETLNIIAHESPRVIGFSSMTANLQGTYSLAKSIREIHGRDIVIGIGGPHVSADVNFVNRFSDLFDFGVVGEADDLLPKIVDEIIANGKIQKINYVKYPPNIDTLRFPARHLIDMAVYNKVCTIISSRGCPYRCNFCSRPAISKTVRYRSAKNVIDEVEQASYRCDGNFIFEDDTFTLKRSHAIDICEEIVRRSLAIRWSAITRANLVDLDLLETMHKAGCREITFGVESGSERIRNEIIKKKLTNKAIEKALDLCQRVGIKTSAFLMLGFPTESRKELEETVRFVQKFSFNIIGIHLTLPLPGSEIYEFALREGKISSDVVDKFATGQIGEGFRDVWPVYVPDELSIEELRDTRKKAYYKFYFNPNYILKKLKEDIFSFKQMRENIKTAISLIKHGRSEVSP